MLSSLNARKIVRDKLGFVWVATQDGLYRFDGSHPVIYSSGSKDPRFSLNGTDIFDLAISNDGNLLWALSNGGGLTGISVAAGTVQKRITLTQTSTWSRSLALAGNDLFVGTAEGLVYRVDTRSDSVLSVMPVHEYFQRTGSVDKIIARDGSLYCLVSGLGILVSNYRFQGRKLVSAQELFPGKEVVFTGYGIYDHFLIVSTNEGLVVLDIRTGKQVPANSLLPAKVIGLLPKRIDCLCIYGNDVFFAGSRRLVEVDLCSGSYKNIFFSRNREDQDWLVFSSSIYVDGSGIWIGSQYGTGWIKDVNTPFTAFYNSMDSTDNKLEHCMTLFHSDRETLYSCTDNGLYQLSLKTGALRRLSGSQQYYSGIVVGGRWVMASGAHGTHIFTRDGKPVEIGRLFPELAALSGESLVAMESMADSLYFFSGFDPAKIFCWDRVRRTLRKVPADLLAGKAKGYFVKRLYVDSRRRLWIVFDASISLYNPSDGSVKELVLQAPGDSVPLGIDMDVCEAGGRFWIAAYGKGLAQLSADGRVERIYGSKEGVHNLGLYRVLPLNDSLVMCSSNEGLTIVNPESREVYNYFEEDGLHSNYFEQFSGDNNGVCLFFGGLKGLTMVDPRKFRPVQSVSNLWITSVRMQSAAGILDTFGTGMERLKIPSSVIQAAVNFNVVNFRSPEKDVFSYRIPELDNNWILIGSQHSIPLIGLSPGTYTVQIRREDGRIGNNENVAQISLVWLPHWYQTWWFKLSILILAVALGYLFFRYRIDQIKKQQEIRKGIASDLHDDLGGTLNALKVYSHLARKEPDKDEYLGRIEESLTQATSGLRDMLWVLDNSDDTLTGILERVRKFAGPLALAQDIRINFESEIETPRRISKTEKRNLFMIVKESINNALKYAECKTIQVRLRQYKDNISLVVQDDGKGFDASVGSAGNGLKNIRFRAQQIKYTANILSFPGGGTTIEVMRN